MYRKARSTFGVILFLLVMNVSPSVSLAVDRDHVFFRAIRERDDARVAEMLQRGTPANLRGPHGTTALMVAALYGTADCVRLLLECGADPRRANEEGATALHWGAGEFEKVERLVKAGADIHARSALGNTPLVVATGYPGNDRVVTYLLERGAETQVAGPDDVRVLVRLVEYGRAATLGRALRRLREDHSLEKLGDHEWSALLNSAAVRGDTTILDALEEQLPRPELLNHYSGHSPFHGALVAQRPEAAKWFLDRGVEFRRPARTHYDVPTLHLTTFFDSGEDFVARALLERGADPAARNGIDETALTWARRRGNTPLIELFEKAGVPDAPDERPEIPNRELELHAGNRDEAIRSAVEGSVALMLRSSDTFLDERKSCVSCHHQYLPGIAAAYARDRGFRVDSAPLDRMLRRHVALWAESLAKTHEMVSLATTDNRSWGLWALAAIGSPSGTVTDAYVRQLAARQKPDGSWRTALTRPPLQSGEIQSTALAIRALRDHRLRGHERDFDRRIARAVEWLRAARPATHQERVSRLLGLAWAGAKGPELDDDAEALLRSQRPDGSWAQFDGVEPDAWATGQSLVALRISGRLDAQHPAYRRGVDFLLRTRFDDGSWFAQRRAVPFQLHFDSGFPFDRNQWISIGATAWAVMALADAVETPDDVTVPARSEIRAPQPEPDEAGFTGTAGAARESRASRTRVEPSTSPGAAPVSFDFQKDIASVLARSCAACHTGSLPEGGLDVSQRRTLLAGGESGRPAIVPGKSGSSLLVDAVIGREEDLQMPPADARDEHPALTRLEIEKLRAWIDQGAAWPEDAGIAAPSAETGEL